MYSKINIDNSNLEYDAKRCGEKYIKWIEDLRKTQKIVTVLSLAPTLLADNELPSKVVERIISNWSLPNRIKKETAFNPPTVDIMHQDYNLLRDIPPQNERGKEQFILEAVFVIKLGWLFEGKYYRNYIQNPKEMQKVFNKANKLKKHIKIYLDELKTLNGSSRYFLQDYLNFAVLQNKNEYVTETTNINLQSFEYITQYLFMAINEDYMAEYLKILESTKDTYGLKKTANRKSMIKAIVESYYYCFDIMPTSTEDTKNHFFDYIVCISQEMFPNYLYSPKERYAEGNTPNTLIKDIQSAIKYLKEKLK